MFLFISSGSAEVFTWGKLSSAEPCSGIPGQNPLLSVTERPFYDLMIFPCLGHWASAPAFNRSSLCDKILCVRQSKKPRIHENWGAWLCVIRCDSSESSSPQYLEQVLTGLLIWCKIHRGKWNGEFLKRQYKRGLVISCFAHIFLISVF